MMKESNIIRRVFMGLGVLVLLFVVYVLVILITGTISDFEPEGILDISEKSDTEFIITDTTFSIITWNFGYFGLGAESVALTEMPNSFFISEGIPATYEKEIVEKNLKGVQDFISKNSADFYLFQEVDRNSTRSHFIDSYLQIHSQLPQYASSFAVNFNVARVPIPILEPWDVLGKTLSGVATFSVFDYVSAERHSLPGSFSWPENIFHLDRCAALHRYKLSNSKELVVINTHNSAYDDGSMRKQQLAYLDQIAKTEFEKGNYVVIGGDWNLRPLELKDAIIKSHGKDDKKSPAIDEGFLTGWKSAYDPTVATVRNTQTEYSNGDSEIDLIDFFVVSPNVGVDSVFAHNHNFEFTDHQAVEMHFSLN